MSLFIKVLTSGNKFVVSVGRIKGTLALECQKYTKSKQTTYLQQSFKRYNLCKDESI